MPDAHAVHDSIDAIARAVLYEGYILWPYRRSALKNQQRWTFGGVYPAAYSRSGHDDDAALMRTECLVELRGEVELSVRVRFLHVVERRVGVLDAGELRMVDSVTVDGVPYASWDEAVERQVVAPRVSLCAGSERNEIETLIIVEQGEDREPLGMADDQDGREAVIVRRWLALHGSMSVQTESAGPSLARIRVDVANESDWRGEPRAEVLRRTFVSTHTSLHADGDAFVSLTDPPAEYAAAAAACQSIGTWPVLVGTAPERRTLLSSPIILADYPSVAPESSGDFFDGGEIDQLLVLSVLSMTESEQAQMRATDPRAGAILDRCRAMSADDLLRLHGATRELRPIEARP